MTKLANPRSHSLFRSPPSLGSVNCSIFYTPIASVCTSIFGVLLFCLILREEVLNQRQLAIPGDTFDCHNFEVSLAQVEVRDVAEHPTMHRKAPITKSYLTQNIKSAKAEKPCLRMTMQLNKCALVSSPINSQRILDNLIAYICGVGTVSVVCLLPTRSTGLFILALNKCEIMYSLYWKFLIKKTNVTIIQEIQHSPILLTKQKVNRLIHDLLKQTMKSYIASWVCHRITSISQLLISLLLKCFVLL